MPIFMGFAPICSSSLLFFIFVICFCFLSIITAMDSSVFFVQHEATIGAGYANTAMKINNADNLTINSFLPPPSPTPPGDSGKTTSNNYFSPFKPSIAVIVGVLTTMFSITFLLLLYAKHCKRGNVVYSTSRDGGGLPLSVAARKNSGVDRTVIESLPIFRFGSLRGLKDGLECAVCLSRFEISEVLRLLPKCKHAFHVECVDTWLDAHSTCPLCRYRVHCEDILLLENQNASQIENLRVSIENQRASFENRQLSIENRRVSGPNKNQNQRKFFEIENRRVSGRHSSAGEIVKLVSPTIGIGESSSSSRRSLDSSTRKNNDSSTVNFGCFEHRLRNDGSLLLSDDRNRKSFELRRFEHRIIISGDRQQRWSDVAQPSDLLFLRSEMVLSDSRRYSSAS